MMLSRGALSLCLAVLAVGCGDPPEVTVSSATHQWTIGDVLPGPGRSFLTVRAVVDNPTDAALSIGFEQFSLDTSGGVRRLGAAVSATRADGCASDTLVSPGERAECDVVFELAGDEEPERLHYAPDGADAVAVDFRLTPGGPFARHVVAVEDGGVELFRAIAMADDGPAGDERSTWSLLPLRAGGDDPVGELMSVEVSGAVRGTGGVDFFSSPADLVGVIPADANQITGTEMAIEVSVSADDGRGSLCGQLFGRVDGTPTTLELIGVRYPREQLEVPPPDGECPDDGI